MKSDLATLVSAIQDIKKRQGRPADPPPRRSAAAAARVSRVGVAAAAITIVMLGFAAWGALSLASYEEPEPPPVQAGSIEPAVVGPVTAAAVAPSPPVAIQNAAVVEPAPAPAPVRDVAARPAAAVPSEPRVATRYIGTLTIDAEPAGEVFINRKSVGRTPVRLEDLRAGSHLVWIERDGYRRWTRVVAVAANRISRVSAELDPIAR
ncbi:MAG TPA: PEGA domain-containing protein [Vicinamibacterales bacterium]|nr:PEGA domain-containing protein [Vicinamibacterales bacterium]